MKETYCIKDKRVTPCHCAVCGIKKVRYVKMGNTPMQTGSGKRKTKKKSKN